jgi:hypothetical protein
MLIDGFFKIEVWISLVVVATVLLSSVVASILWPKEAELEIVVEMPQDFDSLFEDDPEEETIKK